MAITTADRAVVNEGTAARITVSAFDLDGLAEAPATLHYKIDDLKSGTAVRALTNVPTPATATNIDLTPADNAIINPTLKEEPKRITVIANNGDPDDQAQAQYTYYVRNMSYN